MDKRYQVFVSSTYADLKEERSHVIQTLMEMDCIPAGMELFPALDEEQFEFIKKVIDDCDYYLLIIGGRYGSVADDGLSYTEKEFDYAVEKGLKVIALVHSNPDELPNKKSERNPDSQEKLVQFKNKVMTGRLVKFWENPNELAGLVALSLQKTIKTYPAMGWVRGDDGADKLELLKQINELQKEKNNLSKKLENLAEISEAHKETLSSGEDKIEVSGDYWIQKSIKREVWNLSISWNELFVTFGFELLAKDIFEYEISSLIARVLSNNITEDVVEKANINDDSICLIRNQFIALGYLKVVKHRQYDMIMWRLTDKGKTKLATLVAIKK